MLSQAAFPRAWSFCWKHKMSFLFYKCDGGVRSPPAHFDWGWLSAGRGLCPPPPGELDSWLLCVELRRDLNLEHLPGREGVGHRPRNQASAYTLHKADPLRLVLWASLPQFPRQDPWSRNPQETKILFCSSEDCKEIREKRFLLKRYNQSDFQLQCEPHFQMYTVLPVLEYFCVTRACGFGLPVGTVPPARHFQNCSMSLQFFLLVYFWLQNVTVIVTLLSINFVLTESFPFNVSFKFLGNFVRQQQEMYVFNLPFFVWRLLFKNVTNISS